MNRLRALGLIQGAGRLPKRLVECCHEARLVGGLSLSLRATPDEVVGSLAHVMGGAARKLKVLDVRSGPPLVLELAWGDVHEHWGVNGLEDLIHNLGDLFVDEPDVKALAVLGEWEDMLQVWALRPEVLEVLLSTQLLDDVRNVATLRERFE